MTLAIRHPDAFTAREAGFWSGAAAIVLSAHLALAYGLSALAPTPTANALEQALTVDLTPFVITETTEAAPDSVLEELSETTPEEIIEESLTEPVEPDQAIPAETPEPVETEIAEAVEPEPEIVEPVLEETITEIPAPKPEVVLPKAKPKPIAKKTPAKARVEPRAKPVAREQPKAARAPTISPARWHSQVYAAIARRKPRDHGVSGRVMVRFVVTSSGAIASAGVARSSGSSKLDSVALGMVRGARVPAPPAGLVGSRHPFTIPVTFQ